MPLLYIAIINCDNEIKTRIKFKTQHSANELSTLRTNQFVMEPQPKAKKCLRLVDRRTDGRLVVKPARTAVLLGSQQAGRSWMELQQSRRRRRSVREKEAELQGPPRDHSVDWNALVPPSKLAALSPTSLRIG